MSAAISIEGLSKCYRLGEHANLRDRLPFVRKPQTSVDILWALRNVSFEVKRGEVLGVLGRNGAGKSTLLKLLSRITDPTEGRAIVRGRIGSLLEVGTGFHPELTGRENVFLNGAILGMGKQEIQKAFDGIIEFSEIGRFIDTPVKRYSSGMYMRLAFAVAANLDPEILIIDEVLSVGDAAFQKKCLAKIYSLMRSGRTVMFVSHSIGSVSELCQSAVLLSQGQLVKHGSISDVVASYSTLLSEGIKKDSSGAKADDVVVRTVAITNKEGEPTTVFDIRDEIQMHVVYETRRSLETLQATLTVARNLQDIFCAFDTDGDADPLPHREAGLYKSILTLPGSFLKAGSYSVRLGLGTIDKHLIDMEGALQFIVEELSESTTHRGYRVDRVGHIICPGVWVTERVS